MYFFCNSTLRHKYSVRNVGNIESHDYGINVELLQMADEMSQMEKLSESLFKHCQSFDTTLGHINDSGIWFSLKSTSFNFVVCFCCPQR